MNDRNSGFTLIELMIVVVVIGIIASMAIPNLIASRLLAQEAAAIATLKNLSSAQAQLQASGGIDTNNNGAGEFGFLAELSGGVGLRDSTGSAGAYRLSPPVLSGKFKLVRAQAGITGGVYSGSGYVFQLYLPSSSAVGVPEADTGGVNTAPDGPQSERLWCCYAWPMTFGGSGNRAFFVNQAGDLLSTRNLGQRYSGGKSVPTYDAAFVKGAGNNMASTIASNTSGMDDQVWIVVQ